MMTPQDHRYLDACLRFARRHRGLTAMNPSVGTLLVRDGVIVGRGITARGGRPHAEPIAIAEAGSRAVGSTAYVSLEPCAHHGATPPCAQALIEAGVRRVVTAWTDPDQRVDGKGHLMLQRAGVETVVDDQPNSAPADLSGYLNRKLNNRPHVTLKMAVSRDSMIGLKDREVAITGELARNMVHRLRAEHDAILVGRQTVETDDPQLTCRLAGLEDRSPHRFVLDTHAKLSRNSILAQTAHSVPVSVVSSVSSLPSELETCRVGLFTAEAHEGRLALPEFLDDLTGQGFMSLMVEGGAKTAVSFLAASLVDEIWLFSSQKMVGKEGIPSPLSANATPDGFTLFRGLQLGADLLQIYYKAA